MSTKEVIIKSVSLLMIMITCMNCRSAFSHNNYNGHGLQHITSILCWLTMYDRICQLRMLFSYLTCIAMSSYIAILVRHSCMNFTGGLLTNLLKAYPIN